jgi:hypothetical protein
MRPSRTIARLPIEGQADRQEGKRILGDLPRLRRGEGYLWAPSFTERLSSFGNNPAEKTPRAAWTGGGF